MSEENGQETEIQEEEKEETTEELTDNIEQSEETVKISNNDEPDFDTMSDEEFEEYLNTNEYKSSKTSENTSKIDSKTQKEETDINTQEDEKPSSEVDYKAVYESLFKPFKANGKEIAPKTVQDIVSLMQMGANYTKKMQLMAPMKRAVESLNKADIKEDDLNFLIDLHRGDKEAIKSLLKKHSIDPLDLDLDEITYKNNKDNIASDSDVEFSDTMIDIRDSLPQIQDILNNKWDRKSKEFLLRDPKLMRALSEEIQLGRFDKVQSMVEQEKTFGRYKGVSDVEAYIDVVTKLVQDEQKKQQYKENQEKAKQANPQKPISDKTKAAPTKGKTKSSKSNLTPQDLFAMSEEEFNKLSIKDLF